MKWTENGVSFEGLPAEYKELHADSFQQIPKRTHFGKCVEVITDNGDTVSFTSIHAAAEWISQQTGCYVSATSIGRALDENNRVCIDRFRPGAMLFENNSNDEGEKYHVE